MHVMSHTELSLDIFHPHEKQKPQQPQIGQSEKGSVSVQGHMLKL